MLKPQPYRDKSGRSHPDGSDGGCAGCYKNGWLCVGHLERLRERTPLGRRIGLVGCCAEKLDRPAVGARLYTSQLFTKQRAWAERFCDDWCILSAKYGMVYPHEVIEPYDVTLRGSDDFWHWRWGNNVVRALDMEGFLLNRASLVFLCGADYYHLVQREFRTSPYYDNPTNQRKRNIILPPVPCMEDPMRGMQIGQRLSWLTQELAKPRSLLDPGILRL